MNELSSQVPLSIITGFLGAGKTTLLNRLLQRPEFANSLVVINEFGEIGLDHLLVSTPSENMRLLSNGCLCCEVRGDLVETLADAARQRKDGTVPPFDRVLVETTGLADPVPLVQTVVADRDVSPDYWLDSIITMVDAVNIVSQLDRQPEAVKQVAVSDLLVVSKSDMADERGLAEVRARLRSINPQVEVATAIKGELDPAFLFGRNALAENATPEEIEHWLDLAGGASESHGHSHHDARHADAGTPGVHGDGVDTFSVVLDQPVSRNSLATWLSMLASFCGPNLLRVKGLVNADGQPIVINVVQSVLHEPVELEDWPSEDRQSRIVFIVRDMDRAYLEQTLEALTAPDIPLSNDGVDPEAYAQFVKMAKSFMRRC